MSVPEVLDKESNAVNEDEPEEGEIQDDDGSLEDVSSEEEVLATNSGLASYCGSKCAPPIISPHYLPRSLKPKKPSISKSVHTSPRFGINKYSGKTNSTNKEIYHARIPRISTGTDRELKSSFDIMLNEYKVVRPTEVAKDEISIPVPVICSAGKEKACKAFEEHKFVHSLDISMFICMHATPLIRGCDLAGVNFLDQYDIFQEKENRHNDRNDVKEKRVCRRKRQSIVHSSEKKNSHSCHGKPENESAEKRHVLSEDVKKRKSELKCTKMSHSKKKILSPKREKHKRAKRKGPKKHSLLIKKLKNLVHPSDSDNAVQKNSLYQRLQPMLKSDKGSEDGSACETETGDLKNDLNVNVASSAKVEILVESNNDVEIVPDVKKKDPEVITIDDTDSDPQPSSTNVEIVAEGKIEQEIERSGNSEEKCISGNVDDSCEENDDELTLLRLNALKSNRRRRGSELNTNIGAKRVKMDDDILKPVVEDEEALQLRLAALKSLMLKKWQFRKEKGISLKTKSFSSLDNTNEKVDQSNNQITDKDETSQYTDEPDEITTIVDMDVSHTDDEREIDYPETIPLPDEEPKCQDITIAQQSQYFDEACVSGGVHMEVNPAPLWNSTVGTYSTSENNYSSEGYHMAEVYNNPGYRNHPSFEQQLYQEPYPSNSTTNLPNNVPLPNMNAQFNPPVSNIIPIPCISSSSGTESSIFNSDSQPLYPIVTLEDSSSLRSELEETVPVTMTTPQFPSVPEQSQHIPLTEECVIDNTDLINSAPQSVEMGQVFPDNASAPPAEAQAVSLKCIPEENSSMLDKMDLTKMIVLDEVGSASPVENILGDKQESTSYAKDDDEDEDLLRAKLLTTLGRKMLNYPDSEENKADSLKNKLISKPPVLPKSSTVHIKTLSTFSAKSISINMTPHIHGPKTVMKNVVPLAPKALGNIHHLTKVNKFPQKYINKSTQPYSKTLVPSSRAKYWKNKKQTLIKINKMKLPKSTSVQNIQKVPLNKPLANIMLRKPVLTTVQNKLAGSGVQSKPNLNITHGKPTGSIVHKPTSLQVTLPAKKVSEDQVKRKVAEANLNVVKPSQPAKRFVIHLGEDSDSGDEEDSFLVSNQRCVVESTSSKVSTNVQNSQNFEPLQQTATTEMKVPEDFEKCLESFLKQARKSQELVSGTEAKKPETPLKDVNLSISSITPQAVRHLPTSQQLEYRRLKQQIAEREEQKKLKLIQGSGKVSVVGSPSKSIAAVNTVKSTISNPATPTNISISLNRDTRKVFESPSKNQVVKHSEIASSVEILHNTTTSITTSCSTKAESKSDGKNLSATVVSSTVFPEEESKECHLDSVVTRTVDTEENMEFISSNSKHDGNIIVQQNKSTDFLTNQETKKDIDKEQLLANIEVQLTSKRSEVLENLTNMTTLLDKIEDEKAMEEGYLSELERLRLEMRRVEEKVAQQSKLLTEMHSCCAEAYKQVTRGRTECISLSKLCSSIGVKLKGKEYKVPADGENLMFDKLQQVRSQTKRLARKKGKNDTDENLCEVDRPKQEQEAANKCDDNCNAFSEPSSVEQKAVNDTETSETACNVAGNSNKDIISVNESEKFESECEVEDDCPKDATASVQVPLSESGLSTQPLKSDDYVPVASDDTVKIEIDSDRIKRISTGELEETLPFEEEMTVMGFEVKRAQSAVSHLQEYWSPLEKTGITKRNEWKSAGNWNPLDVWCPYELMGSCHDEECSYQHQDKTSLT